MFNFFVSALLVLGSVGLAIHLKTNRRKIPLPPGPRPIWPIGNLHQIPWGDSAPKEYGQWSKIYGPLVYFRTFGREFIVVNTLKAALDLFEKRSLIYSTKPRLVMAGELVGKEKTSMIFSRYNSRLKSCRRIVHSWMGRQAIEKYWPALEKGSYALLFSFLSDPDEFSSSIRVHTGAVLLGLIYGFECKIKGDPLIDLSEHVCGLTAEAMKPGRWLCDSFPWLAYIPWWFPGAHFKRWAMETRRITNNLIQIPFEEVKAAIIEGRANKCWVADAMIDKNGCIVNGEAADTLMITAGTLYAAGIDTTVASLRTFFLMMARSHDVQRRAQAEIDEVIGTARLPGLADRNSLPYVNCLIKEVLRMSAVVPLMPHSLDDDDFYEGYLIPKGTWVMVNAWQIFHDPSLYSDPYNFKPERFFFDAETDPEILCFGTGRRTCAGLHFAQAWLFLNITSVLSLFDINPINPLDAPEPRFYIGHMRIPEQFECSITPRSSGKVDLLCQSVQSPHHALD
ncbi:cytochrome P450 [Gyrodon lividus]|nr:cytochrome P450 [Gyrodon lividus]